MSDPEDDEREDESSWPDTLAEGSVHFAGDAQAFLLHWLDKIGLDADGAALLVGEGPSLAIVHPSTGELLTLPAIAKMAASGKVHRLQ